MKTFHMKYPKKNTNEPAIKTLHMKWQEKSKESFV